MHDVKTLDCSRIAQDLQIRKVQVENVVELLGQGFAIPFIAQYRKEFTSGLEEDVIRQIHMRVKAQQQLADRKKTILKSIETQGKLTPNLRDDILQADSVKRLEDLYYPFKPKKRTPAAAAKKRGLEPLAIAIWNRDPAVQPLDETVANMVDPENELASTDDVLAGAKKIIGTMISETADVRGAVRIGLWQTGHIVSTKNEKAPPPKGVSYKDYFNFRDALATIQPRHILMINRGEREGHLKVQVEWDAEKIYDLALEALTKSCMRQAELGQYPQPEFPGVATSGPVLTPQPTPTQEPTPTETAETPAETPTEASETTSSESAPDQETNAAETSEQQEPQQNQPGPGEAENTPTIPEIKSSDLPDPALKLDFPNEGEQLHPNSGYRTPHADLIKTVLEDTLRDYLVPAIEKDLLDELLGEGHAHAVGVAARGIQTLLLQKPLGKERVLAIDPDYRTGCKVAALDESGNLLDYAVIYPHPEKKRGKKDKGKGKGKKKDEKGEAPKDEPKAEAPNTAPETNSAPTQADTQQNSETPVDQASQTPQAAPNTDTPANPEPTQEPTSEKNEKAGSNPETSSEGTEQPTSETPSEPTTSEAAPEGKPEPQPEEAPESSSEAAPEQTDGTQPPATEETSTETPPAPESKPEAATDETAEASTEAQPAATDSTEPAAEQTAEGSTSANQEGTSQETTPTPAAEESKPEPDLREEAKKTITEILDKHDIKVIGLGNETASRETEAFLVELLDNLPEVAYTIVNEAGASVYSASAIGREELPDCDKAVRAAISIGRRLQDPLAELVKIDPVHLGAKLNQHDLGSIDLRETLESVVQSCVNLVGVDVNTASVSLLRHVAGLNPLSAREIVKHRSENGPIQSREQLRELPSINENRYTQAAGFLFVSGGDNPLDVTRIHPENYELTTKLLAKLDATPEVAVSPEFRERFRERTDTADPTALAQELDASEPLLFELVHALLSPGADPRDEMPAVVLRKGSQSIKELEPGMELQGTVLNVVNFGAFVDIGLKESGLVHISQMANRFVKDPHDLVSVGDVVVVWVLKIDEEKGKVSLTMIDPAIEKAEKERRQQEQAARKAEREQRAQQRRERRQEGPREPRGDRGDRRGSRDAASSGAQGRGRPQDEKRDRGQQDRKQQPRSKPKKVPPKAKISKDQKEGATPLFNFAELQAYFESRNPQAEEKSSGKEKSDKKHDGKKPKKKEEADESKDTAQQPEEPQEQKAVDQQTTTEAEQTVSGPETTETAEAPAEETAEQTEDKKVEAPAETTEADQTETPGETDTTHAKTTEQVPKEEAPAAEGTSETSDQTAQLATTQPVEEQLKIDETSTAEKEQSAEGVVKETQEATGESTLEPSGELPEITDPSAQLSDQFDKVSETSLAETDNSKEQPKEVTQGPTSVDATAEPAEQPKDESAPAEEATQEPGKEEVAEAATPDAETETDSQQSTPEEAEAKEDPPAETASEKAEELAAERMAEKTETGVEQSTPEAAETAQETPPEAAEKSTEAEEQSKQPTAEAPAEETTQKEAAPSTKDEEDTPAEGSKPAEESPSTNDETKSESAAEEKSSATSQAQSAEPTDAPPAADPQSAEIPPLEGATTQADEVVEKESTSQTGGEGRPETAAAASETSVDDENKISEQTPAANENELSDEERAKKKEEDEDNDETKKTEGKDKAEDQNSLNGDGNGTTASKEGDVPEPHHSS